MERLRNLDWPNLLTHLCDFATSTHAKEYLKKLEPLADGPTAQQKMHEIVEAQSILVEGCRPFMESLDHFTLWFTRLKRSSVLHSIELKDVRMFLLEVMAFQEVVKKFPLKWAQNMLQQLMDPEPPLSFIDHLITPEGEIRTDASETLWKLYREKLEQEKQVQMLLDRLVHQHELESVLQDRYVTNREGRWVLPIKSGMRHQFSGIIHASSQSKQTVFMEPEEIVPINNRLRQIQVDIEDEIQRLLASLTRYLHDICHDFETTRQTLLNADMTLAKAHLANLLQAQPCHFTDHEIDLQDIRHPLLVLQNQKVVANSVQLTADRKILLLSGPNAGGKTILLKSLGLACQMARCGLPVAAGSGSKLPFFKEILVAVGDSQSIDQHLSTFAAHLKILGEATQLIGPDHLILVDEICGSTDPEEGSALARSFIMEFAAHQVFAVITSHLGPLKLGWEPSQGVINGSLEYDRSSGQPTYQFIIGIAGDSMALGIAKQVGISPHIIDQAIGFLSPQSKSRFSSVNEIENIKAELNVMRTKLAEGQRKVQAYQAKYFSLIKKFRKERNIWLERSLQKAEEKLDKLIRNIRIDDSFRRNEEVQKIRTQFPELVKASITSTSPKLSSVEDFKRVYPPGSTVFITTIGQDGIVQSTPNAKGEVFVLSQSMRLQIDWQNLKPSRGLRNPTRQILREKKSLDWEIFDHQVVIDVRGKTVDEALEIIEREIDQGLLKSEQRIKIIHGIGSEALKRAIRSGLSRNLHVKKWQAGSVHSGGDGITWIDI